MTIYGPLFPRDEAPVDHVTEARTVAPRPTAQAPKLSKVFAGIEPPKPTATHDAIETEFNGDRFRSRLEARWAVFFDAMGIEYQYEMEGYVGFGNTWYLPDFYLPAEDVFVEVKGTDKMLRSDWDKITAAIDFNETPVSRGLLILGPIPNAERVGRDGIPVFSYLTWDKGVTCDYAAFTEPRTTEGRNLARGVDQILCATYSLDFGCEFSAYGDSMPGGVTTNARMSDAKRLLASRFVRLKDAYKKARQARFEHGETPRAISGARTARPF